MTSSQVQPDEISVKVGISSHTERPVGGTGRFRIYLGAAPAVGKTYAMLNEGRRRTQRGADVTIGFVECHGRQRIHDLIDEIEMIPRRTVTYRGITFRRDGPRRGRNCWMPGSR